MSIAAREAVVEQPVWFGGSERPLFGWVTAPPDGKARGGVVLAGSLGREARAVRRLLRRTAHVLAERGYVSLRFDFHGTGDSAGSLDDEGLDEAWPADVASAVALLRSYRLASIDAVGVRLGATIVGVAADVHDLDLGSLVLWDPCESGRSFLRELGALEALRREGVGVSTDGAVETAEFVFAGATAERLRSLALPATTRTPLADRLLVVARPDRNLSQRLRSRLERERVTWVTASGQGALLDVDPLHAVLPTATLDDVLTWLAASEGGLEPVAVPGGPWAAATLRVDGTSVVERPERLGPHDLFGIVTEPVTVPIGGPTVVFLNVSNEEHTGPSRLWVELARRWAAHGLRCVRFDLTGLGDSPWRLGEADPAMYDQRWLGDMTDVATALLPDEPSNTVFVGLCSGAYLAVEAGLTLRARGVCAINPPVGIDFLHGASRLGASRHRATRALASLAKEVALRLRWVSVVAWKVLRFVLPSTFGVDAMSDVAVRGTDLLVLASTDDRSPYQTRRFDRFFSQRLVAPRNYDVTFVPGLDHSLHAAAGRARAVDMLDEHVLDRFAPVRRATDPKEA
jgi:alpha-beta hydrolase superfamily lysophospholipase